MNLDVDGVDWQIASPGYRGLPRSPKLELQVKSWSISKGTDENWRYPMAYKHFNQLAGSGFEVRRFLAVVIVPSDAPKYINCTTERAAMHNAAYWTSLVDMEPDWNADPESTLTIDVPKANLLSIETLTQLLMSTQAGES
jgi:hypothetical protein